MDNRNVIEEIFEVFQNLLVKLNLEDDIIGYTICLLLLCIILAVKIITLSCVLKKVKDCKSAPGLDQIDISDIAKIVWTCKP